MRKLLCVSILLMITATACSESVDQSSPAPGRPTVVASFYPLEEMTRRIAGDLVAVTNLTPAGTEPHDVELNPDQVVEAQDADLMVYVGGGFSPSVEAVAERRSGGTVDATRDLVLDLSSHGHDEDAAHAHSGEAEGNHQDEGKDDAEEKNVHFWLDPVLMGQATTTIENALVSLVPAEEATLRSNAGAYRAELSNLDVEYRDALQSCEREFVVTSHEAFGYQARRYGFTEEAVSFSPDAEPDPRQLDQLTNVIREHNVPIVFAETLVSARVADSLAREASVRVGVLNPLEGLTQDEIDEGASYPSVMRQNLAALRDALGCRS